MNYAVALYTSDTDSFDPEGHFVGYAIMGDHKLQSTNVYTEEESAELHQRLNELNQNQNLRAHWPNPHDPDVQALLQDETFMPLATVEAEVLDEDSSYLVFLTDADGQESTEIDEDASVIVYKTMAVSNPTDQVLRVRTACEQIANQRANAPIAV